MNGDNPPHPPIGSRALDQGSVCVRKSSVAPPGPSARKSGRAPGRFEQSVEGPGCHRLIGAGQQAFRRYGPDGRGGDFRRGESGQAGADATAMRRAVFLRGRAMVERHRLLAAISMLMQGRGRGNLMVARSGLSLTRSRPGEEYGNDRQRDAKASRVSAQCRHSNRRFHEKQTTIRGQGPSSRRQEFPDIVFLRSLYSAVSISPRA